MFSLDPSALFAALSFSPWQWLLVELAIVLVYVVFSIVGFGTTLVAGPLLAGVLPLSQITPLLILLDFNALFGNWPPARWQIVITELKRLLPCVLPGCALGAYGLLALRVELLMLVLGVFVSFYVLYALFLQPCGQPCWWVTWVLPSGVSGELFGALFGNDGFLCSLYLNGRLTNKEQVRVIQNALIGCGTFIRLGLFLLAGLYTTREPWLFAACLLPGTALGLWVGRRVTLRLLREAFVHPVTWLVLCSGLALVGRYLAA